MSRTKDTPAATPSARPRPASRVTLAFAGAILAPIAVGVVAAALGAWRLMPGVGFWDTAEFQTVPPLLGTAHPTGYPTYVILGWVASAIMTPLGDPAVRMNLLSALLVGVAAGLAVDLVRRLTGSTVVAFVAGLGLAATPIFWGIATHADPHALHLLFVVAILWLLVRWELGRRESADDAPQEADDDPDDADASAASAADRLAQTDRWLIAAAAVTGLSVGNHSLTLLLIVPIALYVHAVDPGIFRRRSLVLRCVAAALIACLIVYLELPLRGGLLPAIRGPLVYGSPDTLGGFVYVVTGEQFRGGLNDPLGNLPQKVADLIGLAVANFGLLAPLVVVGFLATMSRWPAYARLTGSAMAITCFFDSAYVNADIERYYLGPVLIAWTWLAILASSAIDYVVATLPRDRRRLNRILVVGLAAVVLLVPTLAALPQRASAVDRTADTAAQAWLDGVLGEMAPNAVVLSWWSFSTPLWYAQLIEGRRPDIAVIDDRTRLDEHLGELSDVIDATIATRPVYVMRFAEADLAALRARYDLTRLASPFAPNVFRVTERAAMARP